MSEKKRVGTSAERGKKKKWKKDREYYSGKKDILKQKYSKTIKLKELNIFADKRRK